MILGIVVVLLSFGVYRLMKETNVARTEMNALTATLKKLENENKETNKDIEYFSENKNLLKEAQSQFNFRKPDEKMIIVFPSVTSTEE